jgi:hypothetical protein
MILACHLKIDADPDPVPGPAYHLDAGLDPDFYMMRIRIHPDLYMVRMRIRMRMHIPAGSICFWDSWIRIRIL